jgi:uncharacterized membrane protein YfcA
MLSSTFDLFSIESIELFFIVLPIIAFLYASVGHGGASGYLALMALFSFPVLFMKPAALTLNILVAGISFYYYWKEGHFNWKLFYPFAIASIPASFVGGFMNVNPTLYKQILGVLLLISVARMVYSKFGVQKDQKIKRTLAMSLLLGATIGFFSGMIGIGGGIILSPLILLLGWGNIKETAAVSALFIWVNSISGMTGLLSSGALIPKEVIIIAGFAIIGGIIGGYFGSKKMNNYILKYVLSVVLVIAAIKLLLV